MKRSGFTLIELVIAITIIAVSFTTIINIFINTSNNHRQAYATTIATHLLHKKMEQTIYLPFNSITLEVGTTTGTFEVPFQNYYYKKTITFLASDFTTSAGTTYLKKVSIKVWNPNNTMGSIEAVTAVSDHELH